MNNIAKPDVYDQVETWLEAAICMIVLPTVALTRKSSYKTVRAIGQILVVVPLLPWTILSGVVVIILFLIIVIGAIVVDSLLTWWEKV